MGVFRDGLCPRSSRGWAGVDVFQDGLCAVPPEVQGMGNGNVPLRCCGGGQRMGVWNFAIMDAAGCIASRHDRRRVALR